MVTNICYFMAFIKYFMQSLFILQIARNGLKENEIILNGNIHVFIINFSHNSTYKSFHFTELVA